SLLQFIEQSSQEHCKSANSVNFLLSVAVTRKAISSAGHNPIINSKKPTLSSFVLYLKLKQRFRKNILQARYTIISFRSNSQSSKSNRWSAPQNHACFANEMHNLRYL
ncbi:hypothetical protein Tcan_00996, partial [Toxocara canis]